jgi:hypothetical protein
VPRWGHVSGQGSVAGTRPASRAVVLHANRVPAGIVGMWLEIQHCLRALTSGRIGDRRRGRFEYEQSCIGDARRAPVALGRTASGGKIVRLLNAIVPVDESLPFHDS